MTKKIEQKYLARNPFEGLFKGYSCKYQATLIVNLSPPVVFLFTIMSIVYQNE